MFPRCASGESRNVLGPLVFVLICFFAAWKTPGAVQEDPKRTLTVSLEPAKPTFPTPDDVVLRLTVINGPRPCRPIYIDPVLSPSPEEPRVRPFSVLELRVFDENGDIVAGQNLGAPDYALLLPMDLQRIDCDSFYGWNIRLTKGPWDYKLEKGIYRVRCTLQLELRSYGRQHTSFLKQFAEMIGLPPGYDPALQLGEGVYETQETTFEIEQDH